MEIPYCIRRSARAQRVRVIVDSSGSVEVVLPRRATQREAAAAVTELAPWIERRQRELAAARAAVAARGGRTPFLGQLLELVFQPGRRVVHRHGEQLLVPADPDVRQAALERWYRRAARHEVGSRLDRACAATGHPYSRLTIRGQRTRWASCSATGAMSFNWRLLLAPAAVLEYVVWHEVCHLEVLDHSARFWALLAQRCPDHRRQSGWLRRYGATLVLST